MGKGESWREIAKSFLVDRKTWFFLLLGLILLFLTRIINLTRLPIFCDEAIYIRWSQIAWKEASMRFVSLTDGKQPFQTWITIPFLKLFANPLVAGRLQAVLAGLLLPFVLWLLTVIFLPGKKTTPVLIVFLTIFCPYLLFHSRMALAESWLTLFAAGSVFFSYFLAKTRRLDVALLAGAWLGLSLLVKSQALFFLILFPLGTVFVPIDFSKKKLNQVFKFFGLFLLSASIAYLIYNIQRLSPWMHMIAQKNQDFAVPLSVALKQWGLLWQNLKASTAWFWVYLTWPVFLLSLVGLVCWLKKDWRQALFLAGWFFLPFGAINFIARVYNSRYLAFLAFLPLLWAAFLLEQIRPKISRFLFWIILLLVFLLPLVRSYQLLFVPEQFPFTKTDRGYLEGWTAGYGIDQIVRILTDASQERSVAVGTEGNFGLLSQGLEIYFADNPKVDVFGFYPLPALPNNDLLALAEEGKRVFFVLNNTPGDFSQDDFLLVAEFPKVNNQGSLRLYEVVVK
ncbi:MAG: glycosyltransferase family 39 protein [Candidatus Shapirobacteria bacterium]|nr:glycosyltransferase family 39 protein [Candidatus Shapirobacteria bacterium]